MRDFTFVSLTEFIFGVSVADGIGEKLQAKGFKHAMLVYGSASAKKSGIIDAITTSLAHASITTTELGGVRPNPEVELVRAGIKQAREVQVDVVVAIGGGSAIDTGKAIAFGALYDGDVWDFFSGKKVEQALPVVAVLTLPAAGSEASDSCVISNDVLQAKNGTNSDAFRPMMAFMDPTLTYSLPAYQTFAGITDMIAHVCERYFSGVGSVPVTDNIGAGIIRALMQEARILKADPENYDARANVMWASTLAHNGIAGIGRGKAPGRVGGWESHALEHAMSALDTSITHGAGLAIIMPAWMRYVWPTDPERFVQFAADIFDMHPHDESIEARAACIRDAIDSLQDFFAECGMPTRLSDVGIEESNIPTLAEFVVRSKGESFGAFKLLQRTDVEAIYKSAL